MPEIIRNRNSASICNLSLGSVLQTPIVIRSLLSEFGRLEYAPMEFEFIINNDPQGFVVEQELKAYHSLDRKQTMDYNPRASGVTATITVQYDEYHGEELMWIIHYAVDEFLRFIALFLGFCQRRRIILGSVSTRPLNTKFLWIGPVGFQGELIDSIGYGQEVIDPENLQYALSSAVSTYIASTLEEREHLSMLLRRYNDILNLPYTYEKFDGFWRIIECLGKGSVMSSGQDDEYKRLLLVVGAPNGSKNLKNFIGALLINNITYTDDSICSAFKYRNESTHNYLKKIVIDAPSLSKDYQFVAECAERLICMAFGLDQIYYKKATCIIIVNRVF